MKKYTPAEALSNLSVCANRFLYGNVLTVTEAVLEDTRFQTGYGSQVGTDHEHHAYPGGLVVHTFEVLEKAIQMYYPSYLSEAIDCSVLVTAAIFHDYAKIWDYDENGAGLPHRKLIRHLVHSYAEWEKEANHFNINREFADRVSHCILAHHGRYEWGSPVLPQTEEAFILHSADMWSMQFGPGKTL